MGIIVCSLIQIIFIDFLVYQTSMLRTQDRHFPPVSYQYSTIVGDPIMLGHPTIPLNRSQSLILLKLWSHCSLPGNKQNFNQPQIPPTGGFLCHLSLGVPSLESFSLLIQDWAKCFSYTPLCTSKTLVIKIYSFCSTYHSMPKLPCFPLPISVRFFKARIVPCTSLFLCYLLAQYWHRISF